MGEKEGEEARDRGSGRGMLHKSGQGGCWMVRRREFYDVEPPLPLN